jgi:hypothetical protein
MKSSTIPLIEGSAKLLAEHKGAKPFLILEGLEPRPAALAAELSERGWTVEALESLTYRFTRNSEVVEVRFEPTREEMVHAVVLSDLMSKGRIPAITPELPFTLVEAIMAQDIYLDESTASQVEVMKCLLLDEVPLSAALWEIELILNSSPELYEISVKL